MSPFSCAFFLPIGFSGTYGKTQSGEGPCFAFVDRKWWKCLGGWVGRFSLVQEMWCAAHDLNPRCFLVYCFSQSASLPSCQFSSHATRCPHSPFLTHYETVYLPLTPCFTCPVFSPGPQPNSAPATYTLELDFLLVNVGLYNSLFPSLFARLLMSLELRLVGLIPCLYYLLPVWILNLILTKHLFPNSPWLLWSLPLFAIPGLGH